MTPPRVSQSVRTTPQSKLMGFLGDMPTTQARVMVTLVVVIGTALKYFLSKAVVVNATVVVTRWEPSYEWLTFLVLMSGLDAAQFLVKRKTDANYVAAQAGAVPDAASEAARGKAP